MLGERMKAERYAFVYARHGILRRRDHRRRRWCGARGIDFFIVCFDPIGNLRDREKCLRKRSFMQGRVLGVLHNANNLNGSGGLHPTFNPSERLSYWVSTGKKFIHERMVYDGDQNGSFVIVPVKIAAREQNRPPGAEV